jgi:hypothetical protein
MSRIVIVIIIYHRNKPIDLSIYQCLSISYMTIGFDCVASVKSNVNVEHPHHVRNVLAKISTHVYDLSPYNTVQ